MRVVWHRIRHLLHTLGDFQARLLLGLLYAILVLPTGLIARLGGSFLEDERAQGSFWHPRVAADMDLRRARRQG